MNEYFQTPKDGRIKILQSLMHEFFNEEHIDWENVRCEIMGCKKMATIGVGIYRFYSR